MQAFQTVCRSKLFFIGLALFSVLTLLEVCVLGETDALCFLKGLACSLEVVGAVFLLKKKKS